MVRNTFNCTVFLLTIAASPVKAHLITTAFNYIVVYYPFVVKKKHTTVFSYCTVLQDCISLLCFGSCLFRGLPPVRPVHSDWSAHTHLSQPCSLCLWSTLSHLQLPVSFISTINISINHANVWHGGVRCQEDYRRDVSGPVFSMGDGSNCWCGLWNLKLFKNIYNTVKERHKRKKKRVIGLL